MSFIQDTVQVIEILQKCKEFLDSRNLLRFSCMVLVLSGITFLGIRIPSISDMMYNMLEEARAVKLAEAEREQEEIKERERITDLVCGMSDRERNIFDLVKSENGCGIWVSQKDAGVQTLLHKGLLERIGIETSWQDWEEDRARCILAEIPTRIKAVITSTELA